MPTKATPEDPKLTLRQIREEAQALAYWVGYDRAAKEAALGRCDDC